MSIRWLIALSATAAITALGAATVAAKSTGRPDSGTIYAAVTHTVGNVDYVAGTGTDKVLGSAAVTYSIKIGSSSTPGTLTTSGGVTVFTKTGELVGKTTSTATLNSDGSVTFSKGTVKLTKGYGGQKGHSFIGTFTGSGKTATGPFVFHEQGTYR
jgi:hypothetical protein